MITNAEREIIYPDRVVEVPALYFGDRERGSAAVYFNILREFYRGFCFDTPQRITITSFGEHQAIFAEGCRLRTMDSPESTVSEELDNGTDLTRWILSKDFVYSGKSANGEKAPGKPFLLIAAVVFASEDCLLDITIGASHFRQQIHAGKTITPLTQRDAPDLPEIAPYFGLQFTLNPAVFQTRLIDLKKLREVIARLRKRKMIPSSIRSHISSSSAGGFKIIMSSEA